MRQWHDYCVVDPRQVDQWALNKALNAHNKQYPPMTYILPRQLFPNGYALNHTVRDAYFWKDPVWLHSNWLENTANKQGFMEDHKIWLVENEFELPNCPK